MEIVDAHMHLWSPETHPWVEKARDGGHPAGKFGEIRPQCRVFRSQLVIDSGGEILIAGAHEPPEVSMLLIISERQLP